MGEGVAFIAFWPQHPPPPTHTHTHTQTGTKINAKKSTGKFEKRFSN